MALLDVLEGIDSKQKALSEMDSIRIHINRLLNTRRGSVYHMPDYGMPDVEVFYRDLPYQSEKLALIIENTIRENEKRLASIKVLPLEHEGRDSKEKMNDYVVRYKIEAHTISGDLIVMQALFKDRGVSSIVGSTLRRKNARVF